MAGAAGQLHPLAGPAALGQLGLTSQKYGAVQCLSPHIAPVLLDSGGRGPTIAPLFRAGIAQLVERNLAKVEVASSSLVSRSKNPFSVNGLESIGCGGCAWQPHANGKSIEPRAFVPAYEATIGDIVMSVPFVEIHDLVGVGVHAERITVGTFLAFS
jgi:hypothetical protein